MIVNNKTHITWPDLTSKTHSGNYSSAPLPPSPHHLPLNSPVQPEKGRKAEEGGEGGKIHSSSQMVTNTRHHQLSWAVDSVANVRTQSLSLYIIIVIPLKLLLFIDFTLLLPLKSLLFSAFSGISITLLRIKNILRIPSSIIRPICLWRWISL